MVWLFYDLTFDGENSRQSRGINSIIVFKYVHNARFVEYVQISFPISAVDKSLFNRQCYSYEDYTKNYLFYCYNCTYVCIQCAFIAIDCSKILTCNWFNLVLILISH